MNFVTIFVVVNLILHPFAFNDVYTIYMYDILLWNCNLFLICWSLLYFENIAKVIYNILCSETMLFITILNRSWWIILQSDHETWTIIASQRKYMQFKICYEPTKHRFSSACFWLQNQIYEALYSFTVMACHVHRVINQKMSFFSF